MKKNQPDMGIEFYGTTSVGERGQIVIPKKLRDKLKLKKGNHLLAMEKHGAIVLAPAKVMKRLANEMMTNLQTLNS